MRTPRPGFSVASYGLLLHLYPRRFRDRFGEAMIEDFAELLAHSGTGGGRAWSRVLFDLAIDVPRQRVRQIRQTGWEVAADLEHAVRRLRGDLRFVLVASLTLGIALAMAGAAFALGRFTLWQPIRDIPDPERMVTVFSDRDGRLGNLSYPDFEDIHDAQVFAATVAAVPVAVYVGSGEQLAQRDAALVSAEFFETLGVHPLRGRAWDGSDLGSRVVVVAAEFAAAAGGIDLGETVGLNGHAYRVVGILPPGFRGPWIHVRPQLWVPVERIGDLIGFMGAPVDGSGERILGYRGYLTFHVFGRLAPETPVAAVRDRLEAVAAGIREANDGYPLELAMRPAREAAFDPRDRAGVRRTAALLGASAVLVLLVVLGNLGNLARVRGLGRNREMAVRSALGAGDRRLRRLPGCERLLLAGLAMLVAVACSPATRVLLGSVGMPGGVDPDVGLDGMTLLALAVVAACAAGVLALAGRPRRSSTLLRALPGSSGQTAVLSPTPVVLQVALSLVLLTAAALLSRTVVNLASVEPGFDPAGVVLARFDVDRLGYDDARGRVLARDLIRRIEALPEVAAASIGSDAPLEPAVGFNALAVDGIDPADLRGIGQTIVGPRYFEVIGAPLVAGRGIDGSDLENSAPVVVVNQAFEQQVWPGGSAVGQRLGTSPEGPWFEVVGVVQSYHHTGLRVPPRPRVYWPQQQVYSWAKGATHRTFLVRGRGNALVGAAVLAAAVREVEPNLALSQISTLAAGAREATRQERQTAGLFAAASLFTLVVTALGIYALQAFQVRGRFPEIGVRMALGAHPRDVRRMVLSRGLRLGALGLVLGLVGSGLTVRLLGGLLYGVSGFDPASLVAAALVMLTVAVAGSYLPARQASRVDPATALRTQ